MPPKVSQKTFGGFYDGNKEKNIWALSRTNSEVVVRQTSRQTAAGLPEFGKRQGITGVKYRSSANVKV
ncbi:hypothetical protein C3V39_03390 [Prevotella sp. oral taxon 820]|nr:hypothetical protein C3V39_03390 [Prevotella sp. oral taxon 820]